MLDTHALIWAAAEPSKLSRPARNAIDAAEHSGGMAISAITLWELAWLASHGRLGIVGTLQSFLEETTQRTSIRPITVQIALFAQQFPASFPSDPCDCLIGATAWVEGIPLVTKDRNIRACKQIKTIW